jgi:hypothetical protein
MQLAPCGWKGEQYRTLKEGNNLHQGKVQVVGSRWSVVVLL